MSPSLSNAFQSVGPRGGAILDRRTVDDFGTREANERAARVQDRIDRAADEATGVLERWSAPAQPASGFVVQAAPKMPATSAASQVPGNRTALPPWALLALGAALLLVVAR